MKKTQASVELSAADAASENIAGRLARRASMLSGTVYLASYAETYGLLQSLLKSPGTSHNLFRTPPVVSVAVLTHTQLSQLSSNLL